MPKLPELRDNRMCGPTTKALNETLQLFEEADVIGFPFEGFPEVYIQVCKDYCSKNKIDIAVDDQTPKGPSWSYHKGHMILKLVKEAAPAETSSAEGPKEGPEASAVSAEPSAAPSPSAAPAGSKP